MIYLRIVKFFKKKVSGGFLRKIIGLDQSA